MCASFERAQNQGEHRSEPQGQRPAGRHVEDDQSMSKLVYGFAEGDKDQKDLLGGKGANLAEMTRLGLPVPPGFIISTDACREYLQEGREPVRLAAQIT